MATPPFGSAFGQSPVEVPDSCSIEDFIFDEKYGRHCIQKSLSPFTCGITGKSRTISEVRHFVSDLAKGLAKRLGWVVPPENQWERVASMFSQNSIDTLPVIWAVHRLCGVISPINTALSATELAEQLLRSKSKVVFTSRSFLQTAIKACRVAKIPDSNVMLIAPAGAAKTDMSNHFDSIEDILNAGRNAQSLTSESLMDRGNQNHIAFLCFSSGTTGLPVPTIMVNILSNLDLVEKYDLMSSTADIYIGAAPLGPEILNKVEELFPNWKILQGYGLTEAGPVVSLTPKNDIWIGSSGIPLDGVQCRLISEDGQDIDDWSRPGELLLKSPALALGYLENEQATQQTFIDGWLHTGDVAVIKQSRRGNYHIFIVDRLKDLLKVKGIQVSPTELEAHILLHPGVAEAVVIGVEDARYGEVPMAFVVPTVTNTPGSLPSLASSIKLHVEKHKANYKWLRGGVTFLDTLPKTSSGKANRRALRDGERNRSKNASSSHL
ncbi:uncharacterized protein E0L32_009827 [Thyridium curvatum]|uniref:4-coumarate--CoA ligase n=1 Tax=Thyridium curvatum TaxID=1093900 RepID=A0A507AUV9_9PEZI|nr:uncharacterized protein E0L32_009827 [Thyridium curvatum]TPX08638.1 hypothetical protein E0L32_009827 [Thyridium curvatum]